MNSVLLKMIELEKWKQKWKTQMGSLASINKEEEILLL